MAHEPAVPGTTPFSKGKATVALWHSAQKGKDMAHGDVACQRHASCNPNTEYGQNDTKRGGVPSWSADFLEPSNCVWNRLLRARPAPTVFTRFQRPSFSPSASHLGSRYPGTRTSKWWMW
mmetsp:Transcript_9718/g.20110  ORF Transcript_9718/g.20110 Transcript_9718/m.20110 type:complete len:120 (-) Transcript_9718:742-1101(-)